jgi:membrane-bound inhibitor of C-type lysozyme
MMLRHLALLAAGVPLAASAQDFSTMTYRCDRGVEVPATYVVGAESSLVILNVDDRQVTLVEEPTASGARYSWPSDGSVYVWLTKGDEATLSWKTPEAETPVLRCAIP